MLARAVVRHRRARSGAGVDSAAYAAGSFECFRGAETGFRSTSPRMLTRSSLDDRDPPSHRVQATSLASALVFALVQASLSLSFDQDGTRSGLIDRSRPSFSTSSTCGG